MARVSFLCPLSAVATSTSVDHLKSYLKTSLVIVEELHSVRTQEERTGGWPSQTPPPPPVFPREGFHPAFPSCSQPWWLPLGRGGSPLPGPGMRRYQW